MEYNICQSNCTYSKTNFSKDDIIKNNKNHCQKFVLKLRDKDHSLPVMYWFPTLHKTVIGATLIIATFITASLLNEPLSGVTSKVF